MAELLSRWAQAFEQSEFYTDFCAYLPEGLNNAYLDILILLIGSILVLVITICIVSAKRRQRMFERELLSLKAEWQGRRDGKEVSRSGSSAVPSDKGRADTDKGKTSDKAKPKGDAKAPEKKLEKTVGEGSIKKTGGSPAKQDKPRKAQDSGRRKFDVNELIEKKRHEEALKEKEGSREGFNKLEASIDQVKAERDMEARFREMDEESRRRAEKNMTLLNRQIEKRIKTEGEWK